MGLINIIKESGKRARGLALAGALGSSVYLSGCGPALMGLGAGTPGARGAALYAFGSGVTQLEAAEAGKSEVKQTVNVNEGNSEDNNGREQRQAIKVQYPSLTEEGKNLVKRIPEGQSIYFFTYKDYIDIGNNGINADDFFGIGQEFNLVDRKFCFAYSCNMVKGHNNLNYKVWNDSGEILAECSEISASDQESTLTFFTRYDDKNEVLKNFISNILDQVPGSYVLTATVNGCQLRRADFILK